MSAVVRATVWGGEERGKFIVEIVAYHAVHKKKDKKKSLRVDKLIRSRDKLSKPPTCRGMQAAEVYR